MDCNDTDPSIHPAAWDYCNGIDDDCDGLIDEEDGGLYFRDADGDGFGTSLVTIFQCFPPPGFAWLDGDCDDSNPTVGPFATEICDGLDNDCDGWVDEGVSSLWYTDEDGDGFGAPGTGIAACTPVPGRVGNDGDCDDAHAGVFPGATELCNGVDDNCDGSVDEGAGVRWFADADGDGFGDPRASITACTAPTGHTADASDCDDDDPAVHPDADEVCNEIDDDCDDAVDEDDACADTGVPDDTAPQPDDSDETDEQPDDSDETDEQPDDSDEPSDTEQPSEESPEACGCSTPSRGFAPGVLALLALAGLRRSRR